jgi:peptide/nickel transport system permease protein
VSGALETRVQGDIAVFKLARTEVEHPSRRSFRATARRLSRRRTSALAGAILVVIVLAAVFAPLISPYPPTRMSVDRFSGPTPVHIMGTDEVGRDLLSRVLYGSRVSILVSFLAVCMAVIVGVPLGVTAGFRGGVTDDLIMRFLDGFLAVPPILLALALLAALGPSVSNATLAIGVLGAPLIARVSRAAMLVEREKDYVLASRSTGGSDWHVVTRSIMPNILAPLIVTASLVAANAILLEAALSFLGLGVQPPEASWGSLIQLGYGHIARSMWYSTFPGLAIFLTVWSLNILGDGLRDALDPRLRHI